MTKSLKLYKFLVDSLNYLTFTGPEKVILNHPEPLLDTRHNDFSWCHKDYVHKLFGVEFAVTPYI